MIAAAYPLHAQQPAAPAASAPAAPAPSASAPAPAASPTSTPAAQASASDAPAQPSAETLKKAKSVGLKPETHNGTTVYCWEQTALGSRFPTKQCTDANHLDDIIAQREVDKDLMRRSMSGTSSR
jgi:predicted flap endonuclease-1-like 5' DNA nuclease